MLKALRLSLLKRFSRALNAPFRSSNGKGELDHLVIGELGEKIARIYLRGEGRKILYRNFQAPRGGEVDIVARDIAWRFDVVEVVLLEGEKPRVNVVLNVFE